MRALDAAARAAIEQVTGLWYGQVEDGLRNRGYTVVPIAEEGECEVHGLVRALGWKAPGGELRCSAAVLRPDENFTSAPCCRVLGPVHAPAAVTEERS